MTGMDSLGSLIMADKTAFSASIEFGVVVIVLSPFLTMFRFWFCVLELTADVALPLSVRESGSF
jgi:hypothetical protein